jgi:CarboxypepD_reg-like domain
MKSRSVYFLAVLVIGAGMLITSAAQAQVRKKIIQLSGIVLGEDSVSGLPGAHIWVPKAGRGTTSQPNGFFSMPVLVGDSVVISSVGYVRRSYIIPDSNEEFLTVVVEMVTDNTLLRDVIVSPYPTEEVFKQAILALNVPVDNGIDKRYLNAELMALMMKTTPMDGSLNYKYYMDQYNQSIMDRSVVRTNPYLNPFNWARFFRDLKNNKGKN